jgi:alkyl hydroperoxide reductase subunit AhpC
VVVSASIEQVEGWCQAAGVDYPMLADPKQTVSRAYGVHNLMGSGATMPSAFIIDTDSTIVWYYVGAHAADYVRAQDIVDNLP